MTDRDKPRCGMVVEVGYLWREEAEQGHDRAGKRRPCIIVEAVAEKDGVRLGVVPITHNPGAGRMTQELPASYVKQAGVDGQGNYVVMSEMNRFKWPNADPDFTIKVRGSVPEGYFRDMLDHIRTCHAARLVDVVDREEIARAIVDDYREQERE